MSMEITVEPNDSIGEVYDVTIGNKFLLTTLVVAGDYRLKEWIHGVQKRHRKSKKHDVIVGLCAERGDNIVNAPDSGRWPSLGSCKNDPYNLMQLCVGDHCLLYDLSRYRYDPVDTLPKVLKDFLYGATVVGVGIEKIASKLEKDFGIIIPNRVELRDLAAKCESGACSSETTNSLQRLDLGQLSHLVLKGEVDVVKPKRIAWYAGGGWFGRLGDDMIKYSTLDSFLAWKMGEKLLSSSSKN